MHKQKKIAFSILPQKITYGTQYSVIRPLIWWSLCAAKKKLPTITVNLEASIESYGYVWQLPSLQDSILVFHCPMDSIALGSRVRSDFPSLDGKNNENVRGEC